MSCNVIHKHEPRTCTKNIQASFESVYTSSTAKRLLRAHMYSNCTCISVDVSASYTALCTYSLMDDHLTRRCTEYQRCYANVLYCWDLLNQRAEVLKCQPEAAINKDVAGTNGCTYFSTFAMHAFLFHMCIVIIPSSLFYSIIYIVYPHKYI